jgi:Tol biopolymer transport system component
VAAAVLVGGFASGVARSTRVAFPGGQGLIAFSRQIGSEIDIAVVRPDRSGFRVLIPNAADPAWSPDGSYLAFSRKSSEGDMDLWLANADGTGLRELTSPGSNETEPSWSPDGRRLLYVGEVAGTGEDELFIENSDGSGRVQLTHEGPNDLSTAPAAPKWSPKGDLIAFIRGGFEVAVIRPDGTGERALPGRGLATAVDWSPDGSTLLFDDAAALGLYTDRINGSPAPHLIPGTQHHHYSAAWSPDGSAIVYTAWKHKRNGTRIVNEHADLWLMNADGTMPGPLLRGAAIKTAPDWQPTPG